MHNYSVNNKNNNSACNNNYLEISLNDSKDSTQIFCGESNDDHQLQTFSRNVTIDFVSRAFTHNNFSITYEMDVDECYSNSSQCSHICVNLLRSYQCQCPQNLQLSSDNHTCELPECIHEINEVSGQITSFGYPEEYPRDWECSWHLMTTPGHRVKMVSSTLHFISYCFRLSLTLTWKITLTVNTITLKYMMGVTKEMH